MKKGSIPVKTPSELKKMVEGGKKLRQIKEKLRNEIKTGISADYINYLAERLIKKAGGEPSFKMVPKYRWTTCVNVNEGVVHGVPRKETIFKEGDIVSVDLGIFYKGFHTDSSFTIGINPTKSVLEFLKTGEVALAAAINVVKPGNRIYDISSAIENAIKAKGYSPIRALVGHGIGKGLHEEPQIPCFTEGERIETPEIPERTVFAIEVMYCQGKADVVSKDDRWTIVTADAKIAALFEETVAATKNGPMVIS